MGLCIFLLISDEGEKPKVASVDQPIFFAYRIHFCFYLFSVLLDLLRILWCVEHVDADKRDWFVFHCH